MEEEKQLQMEFKEIDRILKKNLYVYQSWGCRDFRMYPNVPFIGNAWSAKCNGLQYKGRIFVSKGKQSGTLSICKEELFGQVVLKKDMDNVLKMNLPVFEAIEVLDKWIERGNLTDEEYDKIALKKAREAVETYLKLIGGDSAE